jgi:hypothetical protein
MYRRQISGFTLVNLHDFRGMGPAVNVILGTFQNDKGEQKLYQLRKERDFFRSWNMCREHSFDEKGMLSWLPDGDWLETISERSDVEADLRFLLQNGAKIRLVFEDLDTFFEYESFEAFLILDPWDDFLMNLHIKDWDGELKISTVTAAMGKISYALIDVYAEGDYKYADVTNNIPLAVQRMHDRLKNEKDLDDSKLSPDIY